MEEETIYIVYVLLIYFVVMYVYGVVTYFSYKNTCSELRNTGSPGQVCVSPDSTTARCWNSGSQLSCSHCVFGYKPAQTGHMCNSKDDIAAYAPSASAPSAFVLPPNSFTHDVTTT